MGTGTRPPSGPQAATGVVTPTPGIEGWTAATGSAGAEGAICLMPGVVLGRRYEIIGALGEGGMGSVYKARDIEVNRMVAIKIIRAELANDPIVLERFKQELVLARQVTHRNVVRIYDLGVADGLRFISMEYIDGRELSDVLRERGKFTPRDAAEIVLQVCRGLEAAHSQGVIHRDLKPQNIMLDWHGRAAVMDFGIARSAEMNSPEDVRTLTKFPGGNGLTMLGSVLGTPRYMSPEQARGKPLDAKSDIYTVGIILYELLTGQVPFSGISVKQLLAERGQQEIRPPAEVNSEVPKRLSEITLKCLESRPEERYQSISELIEHLEIWLGIRRKTPGKLNRWSAIAYVTAIVAVVIAGLMIRERLMRNNAKAHPPVTLLVTDFRNGTGDPVFNGVVEPMFQVALEGASFISSFNRGQARKVGAEIRPGLKSIDERVGQLIAIREGIGVLIGGAVERHGSGYQLSTKTLEAGGKLLLNQDAQFMSEKDLPKAVDKIADRIRRLLGDSTSRNERSAAETFTSGSLASAQKYAEAQQLQWDGRWLQAVATYREATQLDPKMSRAYAGIAAMLANLGKRQEAERSYELALAYIDRESDREKFRTRGGYYLLKRDYQKAAEQFEQLVKQYPVDSAGLANLALAHFYARNMNAALEEGRKAVAIYPHNLLQRNNVGLYAMYAGDFDSAIKESEGIIRENPSFEKAYLCLGISQLQAGSPKDAIDTYQKLGKLSDWGASQGALAAADLAMYHGQYSDAVRVLEDGVKFDLRQKDAGSAGVKMIAVAQAQLEIGERGPALKSAAEAVKDSNDDDSVLYSAAEVNLHAGNKPAAAALANKLSQSFEPEPRALSKLIQGDLELDGMKLHEAVASYEDAKKLADTWLGRLDLGRAYLAAKLYVDAENELDVCVRRRGEASAVFLDDEPTVRYVPQVYYYRGIARSGLHSTAAQDDFRTFLAMKADSTPDAMVRDAKGRVQGR